MWEQAKEASPIVSNFLPIYLLIKGPIPDIKKRSMSNVFTEMSLKICFTTFREGYCHNNVDDASLRLIKRH